MDAISHVRSTLRATSRRLRRTLWPVGLLLAAYACWQIFDLTPGHRSLTGDLFFLPVGALAVHAAWRAGVRSASARIRSCWFLLGAASAFYMAGDVAQTAYELAGRKPYPSIADVLYLGFYPMVLVAIVRFPRSGHSRGERTRLWLDLIVVALGGSTLVIYVVLGPDAVSAGSALETATSVAYPVGDMVLLVALASVLLGSAPLASRTALRLLAAGLLFFVVADLAYGYITLHSIYHGGDPVDSLWMVAIGFFALAGAAQRPTRGEEERYVQAVGPRVSWLPYAAVGLAFLLLIVSQRNDVFFPELVLTVAAAVLTALVCARQLLAQRDLLSAQGQLSHQALHDALTGLPNRVLALDRAEQMLAGAARARTGVAALYVDLDGFKHVNDTFGHAAGDELLRIVAARLRTVIREGDTAARMGGDEFVVLLGGETFDAGPELVAERLLDVLRKPCDLVETTGRYVTVSASIGIASASGGGADALIGSADLALYEAKAAGRDGWVLFRSSMQTAARDRTVLEMDLGEALERDELFLLYQPTIDLRSERIVGVEALVRWQHPTRGVIGPDQFIPIAEQSGLIVPIGRWVLEHACRQGARWHREGHPIEISVNISGRQLDHHSLVGDVALALAASDFDAASLTLEVTETALMRDASAAAIRLEALKQLGVKIAIDDFGTGYSSMAYLRRFPADELKIDRSFIDGVATSSAAATMVHTLVQLGKSLGLQTLAEGIEDRDQLSALQRERCDLGQGFLFARPLEPAEVERFLGAAQPA